MTRPNRWGGTEWHDGGFTASSGDGGELGVPLIPKTNTRLGDSSLT